MSDYVVRDAAMGDLPAVAALHVDAFPESVLGELGVEAVRRNYEWLLTGPHDLIGLVAIDGDRVLGFLFGGVFRGATIGFVKRERWFLARRVVRHPGILKRGIGWNRIGLALRLLMRRSSPTEPEDPDAVPRRSLGVLAIAVDPAAQGRGVGRGLMAEVVERATAQGFEAMHLSVHPTNERALAFYRSLGWNEVLDESGRFGGRMSLDLSPPTAADV